MAEGIQTLQEQPWTFRRIAELHERAKSAGLVEKTQGLPEFAQWLNEQTGSQKFGQGLEDSKLKRASIAFDRALEATGAPERFGTFFGDVGELISPEAKEVGQAIGKDFPRGMLDSSLVLGGMALTTSGVGAIAGVPMMALGGASTFAKTYEATDSPVAGLISTGATFALPSFMKAGAQAVSPVGRALGGELNKTFLGGAAGMIPKGFVQVSKPGAGALERGIEFAGMNLGAAANQELAEQATSVALGQGTFDPTKPEHLYALAVGNLAFMPFQIRDVMVGPKKGEFRSWAEYQRAKAATESIDKALQDNAKRAYVKTAESGIPNIQDENLVQQAKEMFDGKIRTPEEMGLSEEDIAEAMVFARRQPVEKTLFGKPVEQLVEPQPSVVAQPVKMLTFPKPPKLLGEGEAKKPEGEGKTRTEELDELGQQIARIEQEIAAEVAAVDAETVVKAATDVVSAPVRTAEQLEATAKLTNQALELNGEPEKAVTDKSIQTQVDNAVESGLSVQDAVSRAAQATQNRLNRVAAELQVKLTKAQKTAQTAQEELNNLPEPVQKLIGETISEFSKQHAGEMDVDLSDAWTQAAVKWAKDPKNANIIGDLEFTSNAKASLGKVLGGVKKLKTLERTRKVTQVTGGAESIFSEEQPGTLRPEVEKLSETGKETLGDVVKTENQVVSEHKDNLLAADITLEEAAAARGGKKADESYAKKLTAVMRQMAEGTIERVFSKGKFKYTFHDIESLYEAFPGVKDKTIMDFVKDNQGVLGKIMENRLGMKFMSFKSPKGTVTFDPSLQRPGTSAIFPIATKTWFMSHFLNKGVHPSEAMRLGDVAMNVAAAFREIHPTRITGLVGDIRHIGGVSMNLGGIRNGAIGINEANWLVNLGGKIGKKEAAATEQAIKLMVLGHESFHSLVNAWKANGLPDAKAKVLSAVFEAVSQMGEFDRRFVLDDVFKAIIPKKLYSEPEIRDIINDLVNNGISTPDEFLATYSSLVLLGIANPTKTPGLSKFAALRDHILFGDKHLADFLQNQFVDLLDVTDAYKEFLTLVEETPSHEAQLVGLFNQAFKELVSTKQEIENSVTALNFLDSMMNGGLKSLLKTNELAPFQFTPDESQLILDKFYSAKNNFQDAETRQLSADFMARMGVETPRGKTPDELLGQSLNWYVRNLMPAAQVAELYPITKPIIRLGFEFKSIANKFATLALTPFMTPNKFGRLVFDSQHGGLSRSINDPLINEAASRILLEQNELKRVLTDDEITAIGNDVGLSPEQVDVTTQVIKGTRLAMESMAQAIVRSRKDLIANLAGRVLLSRDPQLNAQDAKSLGEQLTNAVIASASSKPEDAAQGVLALSQVQRLINPEGFNSATKAVTGVLPKFVQLAQELAGRPWYSPEVRLGDFKIRFIKDGKTHFIGLKTRAEFDKRVAELNADPTVDQTSIKGYEMFDKNNPTYLLGSEMVRKYAEVEKAAFDQRKAMFPEDAEILDQLGYEPGEAAFKEVAAQGIGKYTLHRKLVAGREEINMMEGVVDYITGLSTGLAKGYVRDLTSLYLADPTMKANPKIQAFLRDHITSVTASPKEWSTIKEMVFQFTLGGNISSLLIEGIQPLFTLVPHLVQNGSSIAGSYKLLAKANKALISIASGKVKNLPAELKLPEMLERASKDGVVDFGIYEQLVNNEDVAVTNLRNLAVGQSKVQDFSSLLRKPLFWYTRFTRGIYTKAASHNTRIAFLSNYLHAMESGVQGKKVTPEQAYQFAVDGTRATMFGGGRAARPVGLFSNLGKTYGAVSAWYMLQHYTTSSIAMMYRMMIQGLGKSGLSPSDTNSARKALGQMVTTQTLMAGTLGLPLVGGTLSILEQIFPSLELKKGIRDTLAGLAGDDKEMGELISDSFLHGGLPRALGSGTIDVSGRFGLGQIFNIDPDYGFRPEGVFGAPGSVLGNILRMGGNIASGRVAEGLEVGLPPAYRNLIRLYNDDWAVRDASGRLIFEPSETEKVLTSIGFRPKRLSQFREQQRLAERTDRIAAEDLRVFHGDLAKMLLSGQQDQVRALLLQRAQEDKLYDPRAGLRLVVQAAQDMSVPIEPFRRGSRASIVAREDLSKTFPPSARPPETALLVQRKAMERSVGIRGSGQLSRHELTVAQMTDQLLALNPTMTRQHAKVLVERRLARNP